MYDLIKLISAKLELQVIKTITTCKCNLNVLHTSIMPKFVPQPRLTDNNDLG
jgi:hypothetical protein